MTGDRRGDALAAWLDGLGASECLDALRAADVDMDLVADLDDADLRELGFNLGQRKRLLRGIAALGAAPPAPPAPPARPSRAERRSVTAVFSDLVGSTELATRHDPEDLARILQEYHAACEQAVLRWGGMVQGIYGDGCSMVFGHPEAREDDAERAVRAALEMVEAVAALGPYDGRRLKTRVAVATGRVVVGDLTGASDANAVAGDTMNLASRLQDVAAPDTVVIASATRRLVAPLFELESRGVHSLKGFSQPVEAWTVVGVLDARGRYEAGAGRDMVGREAPLRALREAWDEARAGRGRTVLISGEAGIGKSRLAAACAELAEARGEGMRRFRFFCAAFNANSALFPFLSSVRREAGIGKGDDPAAARARLRAFCAARASGDADEAAALLAMQFGVPEADGAPAPALNAAQLKAAMFDLIEGMLARAAAEGPVLLEFEDAHWADPTSIEMLGRLAAGIVPTGPILMTVTHRPGFEPPWADAAPSVSRIALERLPASASAAVARAVLGDRELPEARLRDIVAKADGVPLFIEELTRVVLELHGDGVGDALAVPATLEDSLMSRLDRLGPAKAVAQLAATIGRRFPVDLLAEVGGEDPADLRRALETLADSDIIVPAPGARVETWLFRHALIQDAAYASLLRSERLDLHRRIAGIIASRHAGLAAEEPETLARHYAGAEMIPEAVGMLIEAGRRATARAAQIEANNHYQQALALLRDAEPSPETTTLEATVHTLLGASLLATMGFAAPEVAAAFARARALCEKIDAPALLCGALYGVWIVSASRSERARARELADEFLALFGDSEVPAFALAAHFADGVTSLYLSDLTRAEAALGRAVALYDPSVYPVLMQCFGEDLGSYAMIYLQWVHTLRGDFVRATELLGEVARATEAVGDRHGMIRNMGFAMGGMNSVGEVDGALERAEALMVEATEQCYPYWMTVARIGRGWALAHRGEAEEGVAEIEAGLAFFDMIGQLTPRTYWRTYLIEAYLQAGRRADALALADETIADAAVNLDCFFEPELRRLRAESLAADDPAEAEAELRRAIDIARARGAGYLALRAAASLARLLSGGAGESEARALLRRARDPMAAPYVFPVLREAEELIDGVAA